MTTLIVHGPTSIEGTLRPPGDKSISHRGLLLGAVARGTTTVRGLAPGRDVASTAACLGAFGVRITSRRSATVVRSPGIDAWGAPDEPLDCGNSGTTMRLLAGLAARRASTTVFDGDESLRARPMDRLVRPLGLLGADVSTTAGTPPISVRGGQLRGAQVDTGVASAQIKSAVILAALGADGETRVTEPHPSRDHSERLLASLGLPVTAGPDGIDVAPADVPAFELDVAGDPSSSAFLVAAAVASGSITLEDVCLNPQRIAFLDTLGDAGGDVAVDVREERMGEPVGTIVASASRLGPLRVDPGNIASVLDELPLVAVAATRASGRTEITGAAELRVKEADRISATVSNLSRMGADIVERPDGFIVTGPTPLHGAELDACGDHRIAMALAVAAMTAGGTSRIAGFDCADVSWPGFAGVLARLGADVEIA